MFILLWNSRHNTPSPTSISDAPATRTIAVIDPSGDASQPLPLVAVSPGLFDAVDGHVMTGRFFDQGHDTRADAVVVLGAKAAQRLHINRVDNAPTVFIGDRAFSVVGIIDSAAARARRRSLCGRSRMRWALV